MTFHIGQKVVCINARSFGWPDQYIWLPGEEVIEGNTYTISAIGRSFGALCFQLEEVARIIDHPQASPGVWGYHSCRFRPLIERKTDISFAHKILRKASKKHGADA